MPKDKIQKRKIEEVIDENDESVEKPKPKKKLKILKPTEDIKQHMSSQKLLNQDNIMKSSNLTTKLQKIIPKNPVLEQKKIKKGKKHTISMKQKELKRPVWTTAGVFLEEPISPYAFKSTEYMSIRTEGVSSTEFGVVSFAAKSKKQQPQQQQMDFKTKTLQNRKNRDKSMKNIKNLM